MWQDCVAVLIFSPLCLKTTWITGILMLSTGQWSMQVCQVLFDLQVVKCLLIFRLSKKVCQMLLTFRFRGQHGRDAWHQLITCEFVHWFNLFAGTKSPPGRFMGCQGKWRTRQLVLCNLSCGLNPVSANAVNTMCHNAL